MKTLSNTFLLSSCLLWLVGCSSFSFLQRGTAVEPTFKPQDTREVIEGEYVIVTKPGSTALGAYCPWEVGQDDCSKIINGTEYTLVETASGVYEIRPRNRAASPRVLEYDPDNDLCLKPEMEGVACEPVEKVQIQTLPDDDLYSQLWGMGAIQAPDAWDIARFSDNVVVAVVDTGIDRNHPDIKGSIIGEYNAITTSNDARDDHGHGTHVASTACGLSNGYGVVGVSWRCNLLSVKFLDSNGSGTTASAIKAIKFINDYAKSNNVHVVVNHSWGCGGGAALKAVVDEGLGIGVFHVGAAGNSGKNNDKFPCFPGSYSTSLQNVIAVAALNQQGKKAGFSNYGKTAVQLAAPGVGILGAKYGTDGYVSWNGTSMATPHVTGLAALLLSQHPEMSASQLRSLIVDFVHKDSRWDDYVSSGGVLNAFASVRGKPCDKEMLKFCRKSCVSTHKCKYFPTRKCRKACRPIWCP